MSLIVKLKDLEVNDTREFCLSGEELDLPNLEFAKDIATHADIFKGKNFVRVQGAVKTTVILTCARCLEQFELPLDERFSLDYLEGCDPYQRRERVELKGEDLSRVYFQGDAIDLGIGIREAILLASPIAPLCRRVCAGICPTCGENLNRGKCECA
jgi:uncharacterized protein